MTLNKISGVDMPVRRARWWIGLLLFLNVFLLLAVVAGVLGLLKLFGVI